MNYLYFHNKNKPLKTNFTDIEQHTKSTKCALFNINLQIEIQSTQHILVFQYV